MSRIFYDNLVSLNEVERAIKEITDIKEETEELWGLVDDIVHHT